MPMFRKKPVLIEAIQWTGNYNHDDVCKLQDEAIEVWQILTNALAALKGGTK